jgi:hypothetical protein
MNTQSQFLKQIGLESFDLGYLFVGMIVLIVLLLVLVLLLALQISKANRMKRRLDRFVLGRDGKSLEEEIAQLFEDNKLLKESTVKNRKDIRNLYKNMEKTFQKMGIVKYDAFQQMGGQLSFSLVLLDEKNNGFIINSVHSTDGCYSYTKEIKNGQSPLFLGKEEAEALAIAMGEK